MVKLNKGARYKSRFSNQVLMVEQVIDPTPGTAQDSVVVLLDTQTGQAFPVELRVLNKAYLALPNEVSDPKDTAPSPENTATEEDLIGQDENPNTGEPIGTTPEPQ